MPKQAHSVENSVLMHMGLELSTLFGGRGGGSMCGMKGNQRDGYNRLLCVAHMISCSVIVP